VALYWFGLVLVWLGFGLIWLNGGIEATQQLMTLLDWIGLDVV